MQTLPKFFKQANTTITDELERSVVVWHSRPLTIAFMRTPTGTCGTSIRVRDFFTEEILAEHPWTGGLGCATVVEGVIYVFGSTDWSNPAGNQIISCALDANYVPGTPHVVMQMPAGGNSYNTEIERRPDGWMMAVETIANGITFLYSNNLWKWSPYGGCMNGPPRFYCACPTINYNIDGMAYLTALRLQSDGSYQTWIARSMNLANVGAFDWSAKALLVAEGPYEGTNSSDFSFCEWNGITLCTYLVGTQDAAPGLVARRGIYPGRLDQLWAEFF